MILTLIRSLGIHSNLPGKTLRLEDQGTIQIGALQTPVPGYLGCSSRSCVKTDSRPCEDSNSRKWPLTRVSRYAKASILGSTRGAILRIDENPHDPLFICPCILGGVLSRICAVVPCLRRKLKPPVQSYLRDTGHQKRSTFAHVASKFLVSYRLPRHYYTTLQLPPSFFRLPHNPPTASLPPLLPSLSSMGCFPAGFSSTSKTRHP